ncbi:CLUMA_CG007241, isoform A [Clunio marinus]|uniref:CLUMA_CG007241, isoform A n=1 Tax=Clunio marinus TaxID=568069 RepID=A0A1J1I5Q4_9DIPT|nr:CLUMA_CG007241, isoform A [Clunio marinus]
MKFVKTNFEIFVILTILIVVASVTTSKAKAYKRVVIHVPLKVKHHHHTHTVVKHVHHQVPIHYDHHDVHVVHPESHHHEDYDGDYHLSSGRPSDSILGDLSSSYGDLDYERGNHYKSFEKFLRKQSKKKQKLFNNMVIGWKGRSDFDKIASEYLQSIKKQRMPESDDYHDQYANYDDEERKRKRK